MTHTRTLTWPHVVRLLVEFRLDDEELIETVQFPGGGYGDRETLARRVDDAHPDHAEFNNKFRCPVCRGRPDSGAASPFGSDDYEDVCGCGLYHYEFSYGSNLGRVGYVQWAWAGVGESAADRGRRVAEMESAAAEARFLLSDWGAVEFHRDWWLGGDESAGLIFADYLRDKDLPLNEEAVRRACGA